MSRREYDINILFNVIEIKKVIIDPHYETKHSKSISDEVILRLVRELDGLKLPPEDEKPPYSYFMYEMELDDKHYRLVWLLEKNQIYVGVINAYRRS